MSVSYTHLAKKQRNPLTVKSRKETFLQLVIFLVEPIKLEIFLDDRTRGGMQSAERNITGLETQMQEVINILKKE